MKAYLVLDLTVNDFAAFGPYIEAIPAFIARHGGRYIVQGARPTALEALGNLTIWSSSNFRSAQRQKPS